MGVSYSHLTKEEIARNLKFNEGSGAKKMEATNLGFDSLERTRKELGDWLGREETKWCICNMGQEGYDYHIPPNKECAICKDKIDNDHYHCGACLQLSQIG